MSRAFFSQLFDAPAEVVVAQGRVVLAALSLAGIAIDPTEPAELAGYVQATLIIYALYALAVLTALHWRLIHRLGGNLTHSVDIIVVAILLFLTDGFSSPFLVFFTFALLAASLRWDWQGIAVTIGALTLLALVLAVIEFFTAQHQFDIGQAIIRAAYLIVTGTILAYASAHREHERGRLATLAHWPATAPVKDRATSLAETLEQAVSVLAAQRALVLWEEKKGKRKLATWQNGHCEIFDDSFNNIPVASKYEGRTFSRTLPDLNTLNFLDEHLPLENVLDVEFAQRFQIGEFSSAPFQGINARGRLFLLENIRRSDDHLLLTSIIAERVAAEVDRQIFLEEAAELAAGRERASIMRDLHDGLLQNFTAARAQLELLKPHGASDTERLRTVRDLLQTEQRRIRQFVDEVRATDTDLVALASLRSFTEETARFWGCEVVLAAEPSDAVLTRKAIKEISLLIAEAVANAVRHGSAKRIQAQVLYENGRIHLKVGDDGHGFPQHAKTTQPEQVSGEQLPKSLHQRISELRGQLRIWTSASGTKLEVEFSP